MVLVLWLACAGTALAQTCKVLDPELQGSYSGGCKDGLAEGYGEAKGTAEYRGGFQAGRKHGRGTKVWPSGDRYEGELVEDRKEGVGTYIWSPRGPWAGERYSGGYLADRRHGFGTYTWPTGDVYAGPWERDVPVGPPTPAMLERARAEKELELALGRTGTKVCRELTVGISERDRIQGVVVETAPGKIAVRIDDPGRFAHTLNGIELRRGTVVWDALSQWTPCL